MADASRPPDIKDRHACGTFVFFFTTNPPRRVVRNRVEANTAIKKELRAIPRRNISRSPGHGDRDSGPFHAHFNVLELIMHAKILRDVKFAILCVL